MLTEYCLEAKSESEDRARGIWTEVSVDALMQAAAHLSHDDLLGVVYFDSRRDSPWVDRIVLHTLNLGEKLSVPSIGRPENIIAPLRQRNRGAIGYRSHYPLHVVRSQVMTALREFRESEVTMQGLVFADDRWKVTICISGAAFDFTLGDDGWVVSEGDHEGCCDVPPRVSKEEFPVLRLPHPHPHPDADRSPSPNRIIMFVEDNTYNGVFGTKGFGAGVDVVLTNGLLHDRICVKSSDEDRSERAARRFGETASLMVSSQAY